MHFLHRLHPDMSGRGAGFSRTDVCGFRPGAGEAVQQKKGPGVVLVNIEYNLRQPETSGAADLFFLFIFLGLHFFLGDGFFARGIDRNLIRVKK